MKYAALTFFILTSLAAAAQTESQSSFKSFEMKSCVQKKCMRLLADKADSGAMSAILALKNVKLFINGEPKEVQLQGEFGYLDLDGQQLVLRTGKSTETSLDLKTFVRKEYKL